MKNPRPYVILNRATGARLAISYAYNAHEALSQFIAKEWNKYNRTALKKDYVVKKFFVWEAEQKASQQ